MSLQMQVDCPCRHCSWKVRSKCSFYRDVCLELRSCTACLLVGKAPEKCLQEIS